MIFAYLFLVFLSLLDYFLLKYRKSSHRQFVNFYLAIDLGAILGLYVYGEATGLCMLFCILDALINLLNFYLDTESLVAKQNMRGPFRRCNRKDVLILWFKVLIFDLILNTNSFNEELFWFRFIVDSLILTLFFGYILCYSTLVPPTISEAFTDNYKISSYVFVYEILNVMLSVISFYKILTLYGVTVMTVRDWAILSANLMINSGVNIWFILLIFIFDTNDRNNVKNVIRRILLTFYMIVKVLFNYHSATIHNIPMILSAIYFFVMNYDINVRKKQDFNKFKDDKYRKITKDNLICLTYELLFLLTFMSYQPRNYKHLDNYFVRMVLNYIGV